MPARHLLRYLSDDEVGGIAKTGCVIGIVTSRARSTPSNRRTWRRQSHVRDVVGNDYVGLGSDFDGATTVGFEVSQMVAVTQALLDAGFSKKESR
jgi:microsomal dipeptidase-like Zn-dependent dipeptidase